MKKLIAILFVMLIVPSLVHSADRVINKFTVPEAKYVVRVLCIDGHKFVNSNNLVYYDNIGSASQLNGESLSVAVGHSIVQMFKERDGKSLPAKC